MTIDDAINGALQSSQEMQKIQANLQLSSVITNQLAKGEYCAALALLQSLQGSSTNLQLYCTQIEHSLLESIEQTKIDVARELLLVRNPSYYASLAKIPMTVEERTIYVENLRAKIDRLEHLRTHCHTLLPADNKHE